MEINPYLVREFDGERDYPTFREWHYDHGAPPPPIEMLPRLGVMAYRDDREDAALFLYMDNSVGVCFAEHVCTRPGLGIRAARQAIERAVDYLKKAAAEMGYGLMVIHTRPGIERFAEKIGFHVGFRDVVTMYSATREEEE